jgi:hypothetical protein
MPAKDFLRLADTRVGISFAIQQWSSVSARLLGYRTGSGQAIIQDSQFNLVVEDISILPAATQDTIGKTGCLGSDRRVEFHIIREFRNPGHIVYNGIHA